MALTLTAYSISSWLCLKASGISPVSTSKAETGVEQRAPHAIRNALCCVTSNLLFCCPSPSCKLLHRSVILNELDSYK